MKKLVGLLVSVVMLLSVPVVYGFVADGAYGTFTIDGKELSFHKQGGQVNLAGPGDYDWWYGCSATSAGMMMGYYDVNGYSNLVPGGAAEIETHSGMGLVNTIIASHGHQTDFYNAGTYGFDTGGGAGKGYLASGDDLGGAWHSFDCLADFMGTSQDAYGNVNGSTTFYNYTNGAKLYETDIYNAGASFYSRSGMYGIGEYLEYAGYDAGTLYNQYIYGYDNNTLGFTFSEYMAEIDAGRPVMIHVEGHSMYGYGYDAATSTVVLHDTWTAGAKTMTWGGSYNGMNQYAVTVLEVVPEPATIGLLGIGMGGLALLRRRRW